MKSRFPIVELGKHVQQVSLRNHADADVEVFSVTNSEGFTRSTDYFSKEVYSKDVTNYKMVRPGQFAYNPSRINVGSIDYLKHSNPVLVSPLYVVFKTDKEIHADYLFRYLKSACGNAQIRANTEGAVRDSLKYKGLERIKIPLPSYEDQKRITSLLGKVEGLITRRKQHLQQLDDLLKSVFLEMFGNPVQNEKGWKTEPLGKLATIERGRFSPRPRNDPKFYNGPHPFIQTGDISRSNGRLREYTQTLNELGIKVSKEFKVGTIVIAIVGATIGETAILEIPTYAPDSVIGITPKTGPKETESVFIEFLLRFWKPVLRARAPEAARANINIETLRPLPIIWPDGDERQKFAVIVEKVERLKSCYQLCLTDLENLYDALNQKAFSGELDLSRVPATLEQCEYTEEIETEIATVTETPVKPAIELPPPSAVEDLHDAKDRMEVLRFWLESYLEQLGEMSFSAQDFMERAQQKLWELLEADAYQLSVSEYDYVKDLVFEAIESGRLTQSYYDDKNLVQITAARG